MKTPTNKTLRFLRLGPLKAYAWSKAPEDEFFEILSDLAHIYAGKRYRETLNRDILKDGTLLFKEYKEWLERNKDDRTS